jgi:WD40 repeat protein
LVSWHDLALQNIDLSIFYCSVSAIDFSEDSSLISAGFHNSQVRVWTLSKEKLRCMKAPQELNIIDKEADDVLVRMVDDRTASESKQLIGHTGPVYTTNFSPDRNYLLSCSEDSTSEYDCCKPRYFNVQNRGSQAKLSVKNHIKEIYLYKIFIGFLYRICIYRISRDFVKNRLKITSETKEWQKIILKP